MKNKWKILCIIIRFFAERFSALSLQRQPSLPKLCRLKLPGLLRRLKVKLPKLRTHLVRQFAWVDNTGGDIKKRSYQPAVPPFRRHGLSEFPPSSVSSFSSRFHTRALALDFLTLCRPSETLLPYLALNSQRKRSMKGVSTAPGNSAEK